MAKRQYWICLVHRMILPFTTWNYFWESLNVAPIKLSTVSTTPISHRRYWRNEIGCRNSISKICRLDKINNGMGWKRQVPSYTTFLRQGSIDSLLKWNGRTLIMWWESENHETSNDDCSSFHSKQPSMEWFIVDLFLENKTRNTTERFSKDISLARTRPRNHDLHKFWKENALRMKSNKFTFDEIRSTFAHHRIF